MAGQGARAGGTALALVLLAAGATGCTSSAGSGQAAAATATAPPAGPVAPAATRPHSVPKGWTAYRSSSPALAVALPTGWRADASGAPVGELVLDARQADDGAVTLSARPAQRPLPRPVLLQRAVGLATRGCEVGRRTTGHRDLVLSGQRWATATASCGAEQEEPGEVEEGASFLVAVTVARGQVVTLTSRCPADDFARVQAATFLPLLRSVAL